MLIREARRRIDEGDKLGSVVRYLNKLRGRVRMCFSVDDMTPLRRSGRLGNVKMSISTVLNIKPILELRDGAIVSAGLARGRVEQARRLGAFCAQPRASWSSRLSRRRGRRAGSRRSWRARGARSSAGA